METIADTGPLFDFLLLHFATTSPAFKDAEKGLCYVRDSEVNQAILTEYFDSEVQALWTTPGVLAEMWRLSNATPDNVLKRSGKRLDKEVFVSEFWGATMSWLRSKPLWEENVCLAEQQEDLVKTHGPIDIGLLELAKRRRLPILTGDGSLKRKCLQENIVCRHVSELWK